MTEKIEIYQTEDGGLKLPVTFNQDDLWLSQAQMALLFSTSTDNVSLHLKNIFSSKELDESSTTENFSVVRKEGVRQVTRQIKHYSLDAIISLGYRINSANATRFRQWATKTLKQHLLHGYTLNQERFDKNAAELKQALALINKAVKTPHLEADVGRGLVEIISRYTNTFLWLQRYDEGLLEEPRGQKGGQLTPLAQVEKALAELKQTLISKGEATELFAQLRADGLSSIWGNLEQTVFGEPAYPSIESKAAHLLYFVVKNHPFSDGNKRSGAFLFVDFLHHNDSLYNASGEAVINDTGLAAITLLVAESVPKDKEIMIRLIMNMLSQG